MAVMKFGLFLLPALGSLAGCAVAGTPTLYSPSLAAVGRVPQDLVGTYPARFLRAHNAERAAVGVPPLVWDDQLGAAASAYAAQLAQLGVMRHSNRAERRGVGENLWMGTRGAYRPEQMVGNWASEKTMFRPGIFPNVSTTGNWIDVGHYTQMIWRDTSRVGCGVASSGRFDFLVCRYAPAGNIDGRPVP